ncbi:dihydropteroate synthase [Alisedimentitalea sp. MJ-SS2]|uniref:dihydropteroate synthase n=1 Tax=Aliisedimentitalea sp. MJ-SS2 TaxID=3049795 RepID=UPI00290C2809|nr:dihydropteroate synthase [Alisedimentitalea sp. MJ-SS2]MDU8927174.1 dihydropteroate synthase [Alisedimentitalea sp. MJ-SS2]
MSSLKYFRPLVQTGVIRPDAALSLAGGACWFTQAEEITRDGGSRIIPARDIPQEQLDRLTVPRASIAGLDFSRPLIMGVLNVTPDSFSDGGDHSAPAQALAHAKHMVGDGADLIDVGGESTRPGALEVPTEAEIARTVPVIAAIRAGLDLPISIDTRKKLVAQEAKRAGADIVNDVSGFTFDRDLAPYCAEQDLPVCVMHAQGDPETMQENPRYDDALLDVYDFLAAQVIMLGDLGIPRKKIIVDPGIGFGKRIEHSLRLLNGISLFHGLGCPILLGASRKGFIRTIGVTQDGVEPGIKDRMPGSLAVALTAVAQGVQILRVHDVRETSQGLALWSAVTKGTFEGQP